MRILYVIDTHVHADHISSGRELAQASGGEYVLFEGAGAAYPFRGVRDGETLDLGNVAATVLHTPGHTPEHISLFASIRRLRKLPDHVEVLPGVYSGSVCGRSLSGKPSSTIGSRSGSTRRSGSRTRTPSSPLWSPTFRPRLRRQQGFAR